MPGSCVRWASLDSYSVTAALLAIRQPPTAPHLGILVVLSAGESSLEGLKWLGKASVPLDSWRESPDQWDSRVKYLVWRGDSSSTVEGQFRICWMLCGIWGDTWDLVCTCWPGTKVSATGSCTQPAWEKSEWDCRELSQEFHQLIQDPWASHSSGWFTCNEWITVIHMRWETTSWDNDPSSTKASSILYLSDSCGQKRRDQSSQKSTVFVQKFSGVLEKKIANYISDGVSLFFYETALKTAFPRKLIHLFQGEPGRTPSCAARDGCVLCAHNVPLAGRLFFSLCIKIQCRWWDFQKQPCWASRDAPSKVNSKFGSGNPQAKARCFFKSCLKIQYFCLQLCLFHYGKEISTYSLSFINLDL